MFRARGYAPLALLSIMLLSVPITSSLGRPGPLASTPTLLLIPITIHVVDPQGLNIDGAQIHIINENLSILVDQGFTANGTYFSKPLLSNFTYNVIASTSAQTKQQEIKIPLSGANLVVQFVLVRSLPVAQLTLTSTNLTPDISWTRLNGNFVVTNTGQANVTVATIRFNASSPFSVIGTGSQFSLGPIQVGKVANLAVTFAVQPTAAEGVYTVPYSLVFTDAFGRNYTSPGSFGIEITRAIGSSALIVSSVAYSVARQGSGYTVTSQLVVSNKGQTDITYSVLQLNSTAPLLVLGSGSQFSLGPIGVGASVTQPINFAVQPGTRPGAYSIGYTLLFRDSFGRNFTSKGSFGLNLNNLLPITPSQIIVASTKYTLQHSGPGYLVSAQFVLQNTGDLNITRSVLQFNASAVLAVFGTGSQFSVGTLQPGQNRTVQVSFITQTKPQLGVYSIPYVINSTDSMGDTSAQRGIFSVMIVGSPQIKIASISPASTKLVPGADTTVRVNLTNIGDGVAIDVTISIAGMTSVLSGNSSYLGIIQPGANETTDFGLNFPTSFPAGVHFLNFIIAYKDPAGNVFTDREQYNLNVFPLQGGQPTVKVQNIITDPVVLNAGTSGLMTFFLENVGNQTATNIVAEISGAKGILAAEVFNIGAIKPNATATTIVGVNVDPSTSPGTHLLTIGMSYQGPSGRSYNQSSFVEVTIYPVSSLFTPVNDAIIGGVGAVIVGAIIVARRLNLKI